MAMRTRCYLGWLAVLLADLVVAVAGTPAEKVLKHADDWFLTDDAERVLANILSWQTVRGDWPKNVDTTAQPFSSPGGPPSGTFDNGATVGELRVLARAVRVTGKEPYRQAFLRGFDHLLAAQYPHGGWPQFYPPGNGYHRHVTFNDGTMVRLMEFLDDAHRLPEFDFLDARRRAAAGEAVERAIDCVLRCQVVVEGTPTVWCAQHDADTLAPAQGRSFEPPSLSGAESAGILRFLMRVPSPSDRIIRAVEAGVAWFEAVKIEGYRYRRSDAGPSLVADAKAPALWARFYEIGTNRPIFCDRDGVVKYDLQEIGSERRGGYTWYGTWGEEVRQAYARWPYRQR